MDYHFVDEVPSGEIVELVNYLGTSYGVTREEFDNKFEGNSAVCVVVEPHGVEQYLRYCHSRGINIAYISLVGNEIERIRRLILRDGTTDRSIKRIIDSIRHETNFMNQVQGIRDQLDPNGSPHLMVQTTEVVWEDVLETVRSFINEVVTQNG